MKIITKLITIFAFISAAYATPENDISSLMKSYWTSYSKSDFQTAAKYIHPNDLESAKKKLIPVFLAAGDSNDPELNSISDAFFLDIPQELRPNISGKQVFVGLSNFVNTANPQLFDAISKSKIEIIEVSIGSAGNATVTYRMMIEGTPTTDIERFTKFNGKWFVRLKENPKDTAIKLRKIFEL